MEKKKFAKLKIGILYAEDEEVVRSTISEMLRRRVEQVMIASDGQEALDLYKISKPDLVISDIKMPNLDGLEMIRQIKLDDPDIPVIITSAHSESEFLLQAIDLGVDKFVRKPVDNRELFKEINKVYKQIYAQQRLQEEEARRLVAQRNLRESQEQLRALFENVVVGMGIVDTDQQIIFANQTLAAMFFEEENSVLMHSISEYLLPESLVLKRISNLAGKNAENQITSFRSEEKVVIGDKREFWAEISISVIVSAENLINKFIIVVNDVDSRVHSQQERDTLYNSLISELETAASVQSFFLPNWFCVEDNLLITNNYTPSTNVGGDLFDIINLTDSRYLVYIGDISGHGVQSALIMTAVKSTIKMLVENTTGKISPSTMVNQLNQLLSKDVFRNNYLTLLLGVLDIDNQQFVYYNAGHPPIIRYKKSTSEVEIIRSSGAIPIGWIEDYEFIAEEEDVLQMDEYSSYFFYTDGLFECENPQGEELGIDGIIELMKNYPSDSSTLMLPYVLKKMIIDKGFDISADDFTILNLNLRRDLNDKIRYYIIDPRKNSTGETGKYCEEFLKARDAEELSFATELLVNEYLNKVLAHSAAGYKDDIIVIRLRLIKDELQLTFWDKGEAWELPAEDGDDDFLTDPDSDKSSLYIIRRLAEKIIQKRLAEVNETIFYLSMNKEENGSNGK